MPVSARVHIALAAVLCCAVVVGGCTSPGSGSDASHQPRSAAVSVGAGPTAAAQAAAASHAKGTFTMSFAGDVHFSGRLAMRLAANPRTVFAQAATGLRKADLTMVNLETAITTRGVQQHKLFTFRAPPAALDALRYAGVDVATMANNHGADYGNSGLRDTFAAIKKKHFPVIGIGANATAAFAPYRTTLNGVKVAIFAADQVNDETTLPKFSAGAHKAGVANAYNPVLITKVRAARKAGYVVVVYLHWGIEYQTCPSSDQNDLAAKLGHAGAAAVIGTHAHVLQGAGWRSGGTYVAYGLGNYLWWKSFGNNQDDNGVLTLSFAHRRVVAAHFTPSHLDSRGVPVPATGAQKTRIAQEFAADRSCTNLAARPPT